MGVYRKVLRQVKYRFREDLIRRLERAAKRNEISVNEEVVRRLEDSFSWVAEREFLLAQLADLASDPTVREKMKSAGDRLRQILEETAERDFQQQLPDILKGGKS